MADASCAVVVATYDALPWLEQCLQSVAGVTTVVVDNGSTDGTVALVRARFPDVIVVEQANVGLGAAWNRGLEETSSDWVLILNADAWVTSGSLERLIAFGESRPDAAVIGPRLLNVDGTLQRSVRGVPTPWRLATEYFFLRKLAPRSRLFNAFYGSGFHHDEVRETEVVMGACMLVRRAAIAEVGSLDEAFFLFSEETDWCYRFRQAGWKVLFYPGAECVHVGGAAHGGRLYRENLRGHLRFLAKHRGPREAERARRLLRVALVARGRLFRGERGRMYRDAAAWLGTGDVARLLER